MRCRRTYVLNKLSLHYMKTRTKTFIRYAKENYREKRERRRERKVGGERERESERERHRALLYRVCALVENLRETSQTEK